MMKQLDIILDGAISIVKEVGGFIREEATKFDRGLIEYKGKNDLVSYVDKEAELRLVGSLSKLMPEAGIIAEEGTGEALVDGYNWIIDPLDGTTNFIHGLPTYAVSVALVHQEQILIGIVYEINRDECFYATHESEAYCNGKRIQVSTARFLNESLIATGFPHQDFDRLDQYMAVVSDLTQNLHGLRRVGSAAVDLAYVACGRYEGFFEYNLKPWDVAAGALIVEKAGGRVTDFKGGRQYLFGREIIATGHIHEHMLTIFSQHNL